MKNLVLCVAMLICSAVYSQISPSKFNYGGVADEVANDIIQNFDGDFLLAGYTQSYGAGASDFWVIKANANGYALSSWTYGGTDNDKANVICQTIDGGYIIAGYTASFAAPSHNYDMWIVKIDAYGDELWNQVYGEGSIKWVALTDDGDAGEGLIIAGTSIIKTDGNGQIQWSVATSATSIRQTNDGGYIALNNPYFDDINLIKLDANGGVEWTQIYSLGGNNFAQDVIQTTDGGYLITVNSSGIGSGEIDAVLIKTDALGNQLWIETYGGIYHDEVFGVEQTIDGGYIIAGLRQLDDLFDNDLWVIKLDAQGTIQWDWSEDLGDNNWAHAIIQTADGGYAVAGLNKYQSNGENDMYLVLFNPDPLMPWFIGTPTLIAPGSEVQFSDGSLGNPTSWQWDFGNGESFSGQFPAPVVYNEAGNYNVTLTVDGGLSFTRENYIIVTNDPPPVTYCESYGDAINNWIASVNLNGIINTSENVGYEDFTSIIFTLSPGENYDIIIGPGSVPAYKKIKRNFRVWIDFDNNNFTTDDEVFSIDNEKGEVTGSITIPPDFFGYTRMRVSMSSDIAPTPCGYIQNGEVEDYTIYVILPTPQPPLADFIANPLYVSPNENVYFSDQSLNNPLIWEWDFNDDGVIDSGEPNPVYAYSEAGQYTVTLTIWNEYGYDTKIKYNYIQVSSTPPLYPYCEPQNIQNGLMTYIDEVVLGPYSNLSGYNPGGYIHFTNVGPFQLGPGNNYTIILKPGSDRSRYFWRLWIDLNGNGSFEEDGELLFSANNKKGNVNGAINIPLENLTSNITRMRVMMKENFAPLSSCEDGFDGEVEDYNIEFQGELKNTHIVSESPKSDLRIYPNPIGNDILVVDNLEEGTLTTIHVYNGFGKLIHISMTRKSKATLDLTAFDAGVYTLKISSAYGISVTKVVKTN